VVVTTDVWPNAAVGEKATSKVAKKREYFLIVAIEITFLLIAHEIIAS
jgi:hypothetical protein